MSSGLHVPFLQPVTLDMVVAEINKQKAEHPDWHSSRLLTAASDAVALRAAAQQQAVEAADDAAAGASNEDLIAELAQKLDAVQGKGMLLRLQFVRSYIYQPSNVVWGCTLKRYTQASHGCHYISSFPSTL